jgi:hypothetical protein
VEHRQYHLVAGCAAFIGALVIGVGAKARLLDPGAPADDKAIDMDLTAIEVSVAKPAKKASQPQKQHRDPVHKTQQGLAHDDKKPPPEQKKPDDKQPKSKPDDDKTGPTTTINDNDAPVGKITPDQGTFNPNKFGTADVDKGDPYFQEIWIDFAQAGGTFPTIINTEAKPVVCVHLDADGKVEKTLFKQKSGDGDADNWADHALTAFEKARNANPKPVPTKLLSQLDGWICFQVNLANQP